MEASYSSTHTWTPPTYDISASPALESRSALSESEVTGGNFARRAKWCPDGSVALAHCENATFEYLKIPSSILSPAPDISESPPLQCMAQAAPIVDFAWYPMATYRSPATFCFVASVRECPVKLLDAASGRLRASYKIVDHRERHIAPHSLAFNPAATRLYCGFEDAIEVFDVNSPGDGTRLHTTPSKKSKDGLKGIISSLAFSPDPSSELYAAGSLHPSSHSSSNIALFTGDTGATPVTFVGDERDGVGYGIRASVSQVAFNPTKPHLLYASFRRLDSIYSWDLRGDVGTPVQVFQSAGGFRSSTRKAVTNQRFYFDIDIGGNWLSAGNQDGYISLFDLNSATEQHVVPDNEMTVEASRPGSSLKFQAHDDAIGSVGFHPLRPLLLSVSGSRNFNEDIFQEDYSSNSDTSDDEGSNTEDTVTATNARAIQRRTRAAPFTKDASIKLWNFGGPPVEATTL